MKVIENRTTYHCDFCKKFLFRESAMKKHEDTCLSNPKNSRACIDCGGCNNLEKVKLEVSFHTGYRYDEGEVSDLKEVDVFKCTKFDKLMFPYSIERRKLHERYPETYQDQEPMPKECEHFEEIKWPF